MTTLYGRILPRPQLLYQDELFVHGNSWNLSPVSFRKPVQLTTNWACLRIVQNSSRDWSIHAEPCRGRLKNFQSHLRRIGITVLDNDYHGDLEIKDSKDYSRLDEWFRDCQRYRVTFLIVLLPDIVSSQLYNHIKKYGDIKHGIHTVCVKYNKLGDSRYDDNVALVSTGTFLFYFSFERGGTRYYLRVFGYIVFAHHTSLRTRQGCSGRTLISIGSRKSISNSEEPTTSSRMMHTAACSGVKQW